MASRKFDLLSATRVGDQSIEPDSQFREHVIEAPILRHAHEPPRRKQCEEAPVEGRKHDFELALNGVFALVDRVEIVTKGDERRDIDREAFELFDDIDIGARVG
jgi:hypothetical protein